MITSYWAFLIQISRVQIQRICVAVFIYHTLHELSADLIFKPKIVGKITKDYQVTNLNPVGNAEFRSLLGHPKILRVKTTAPCGKHVCIGSPSHTQSNHIPPGQPAKFQV